MLAGDVRNEGVPMWARGLGAAVQQLPAFHYDVQVCPDLLARRGEVSLSAEFLRERLLVLADLGLLEKKSPMVFVIHPEKMLDNLCDHLQRTRMLSPQIETVLQTVLKIDRNLMRQELMDCVALNSHFSSFRVLAQISFSLYPQCRAQAKSCAFIAQFRRMH